MSITNIKQFRQQYEYECVCGHIWIDNENNSCPMCCERNDIVASIYKSLPPEKFADRTKCKK